MLVKCIDNEDVDHLYLDFIYKAEPNPRNRDQYLIQIDGTPAAYMKSRFVEVPVFKVRAKESTSSGLVKNQLYEVVEFPLDTTCWLIDPYTNKNGLYKTRFHSPVDNRVPMGSRPLVIVDKEEERLRKILTTRAYPEECDCGTNRSVCIYHK